MERDINTSSAFSKEDIPSLATHKEVLEILNEKGPFYCGGIRHLRDRYEEAFGEDLITHYPYVDCDYRGCILVAVQEGVLLLPYDEIDKYRGELIAMQEIRLIGIEHLEALNADIQAHADGFAREMGIFAFVCHHQKSNQEGATE